MKAPVRRYWRELKGRKERVDSPGAALPSSTLWAQYARPPLQRPAQRRRHAHFLFLEEPQAMPAEDNAAYNPLLPLALRHRARERVVHYLDFRPRFAQLAKLIPEGSLHAVMAYWSNADLEYYRSMPANERSHPLHRALHFFQPDLVAFFVAVGLSPGQAGTVHPYSGDNLASEDGFTHGVTCRDLWSFLWQANIIDGASAKQPRLLREMHAILGVGPEAGRDDAACQLAAVSHMARLYGLYSAPPTDPAGERLLRVAHYHRFFFERGPLPLAGRDGTRYEASGAEFRASIPDTSVFGAEHTAAAALQRQRRAQVAAARVTDDGGGLAGLDDASLDGLTNVRAFEPPGAQLVIAHPAAAAPPPALALPVLAMLRTDRAAFPPATIMGMDTADACNSVPFAAGGSNAMSPTFDDDLPPPASFAHHGMQSGPAIALVSGSLGEARNRSKRKPLAPQRLAALRSPGGKWPAVLQGAAVADLNRAPADASRKRRSDAPQPRPTHRRAYAHKRRRQQDVDGLGDLLGSAADGAEIISLSSNDSDSSDDSSDGLRNDHRAANRALGETRNQRGTSQQRLLARGKDAHPGFAFDMDDPVFDSSSGSSGTDSSGVSSLGTDRSHGSRAAFARNVPVRINRSLFVVKGAGKDDAAMRFEEDITRACHAPPTALGRAWFDEGSPTLVHNARVAENTSDCAVLSDRMRGNAAAPSSHRRKVTGLEKHRGGASGAQAAHTSSARLTRNDAPRDDHDRRQQLVRAWGGPRKASRSSQAIDSRMNPLGHRDAAERLDRVPEPLPAIATRALAAGVATAGARISDSPPPIAKFNLRQGSNMAPPQSIYDASGRRRGPPDVAARRAHALVSAVEPIKAYKAPRSLKREIVQAGFFSFQRAQMKALQLRVDAMTRWIQLFAGRSEHVSGWAQQQSRVHRKVVGDDGYVTPVARLMQLAPAVKRSKQLVAAANAAFPEAQRAPQPPMTHRETDPAQAESRRVDVGGYADLTEAVDRADDNVSLDEPAHVASAGPEEVESRVLELVVPAALLSSFPLQLVVVHPNGGRYVETVSLSSSTTTSSVLREPWDALVCGLTSPSPTCPVTDGRAPLETFADDDDFDRPPSSLGHAAADDGLDVSSYLLRLELADAPEEAVGHLLLNIAPLTFSDLESEEMRCVASSETGQLASEDATCQSCIDARAVLKLLVQILQQTTNFVRRRVAAVRSRPAVGEEDESARRTAVRLVNVLFVAATKLLQHPTDKPPACAVSCGVKPVMLPVVRVGASCGECAFVLRAHATAHAFIASWCCEFADFVRESRDDDATLQLAEQSARLLLWQAVQVLVDYPSVFDPLCVDPSSSPTVDAPAAWMLVSALAAGAAAPARTSLWPNTPTTEADLAPEFPLRGLISIAWCACTGLEFLPSWTTALASPASPFADVARVEVVLALVEAVAAMQSERIALPTTWAPLNKQFLAVFAPVDIGVGTAALAQCSLRQQSVYTDRDFRQGILECVDEHSPRILSQRRVWHTNASVSGVRTILLRRSEGFEIRLRAGGNGSEPPESPGFVEVAQGVLTWSNFLLRRMHEQLGPLCNVGETMNARLIEAWTRALSAAHAAITTACKPPMRAFRLPGDCMRVDLATIPTRPRVYGAGPCVALVSGVRPVETTPLVRGWLSRCSSDDGDAAAQLIYGVDSMQLGLIPDWLIAAACAGKVLVVHWRMGAQTYVEWIRDTGDYRASRPGEPLELLLKRMHRALQAIVGGWLYAAAGGRLLPQSSSGSAEPTDSETVSASCCVAVAQCLRRFAPRTQPCIVRCYAVPPAIETELATGMGGGVRKSLQPPLRHRAMLATDATASSESKRFLYLDIPTPTSTGTSVGAGVRGSHERAIASRLCSHPELQVLATQAVLEMLTSTQKNRAQRVLQAVNLLADVQHSDAAARAINVQALWATASLVIQVASGFTSIVRDTVDAFAAVVAATLWDMDSRALAQDPVNAPSHASALAASGSATRRPQGGAPPADAKLSSALNASADVWVLSGKALARWGPQLLEQDLAVLQLVADALLVLIDLQAMRSLNATAPAVVKMEEFSKLMWRPVECSFRRSDDFGVSVDCMQRVSLATMLQYAVSAFAQRTGDASTIARTKARAGHTCRSIFTLLEASLVGERLPLLRVVCQTGQLACLNAVPDIAGSAPLGLSDDTDVDLAALEEMGAVSEAAGLSALAARTQLSNLALFGSSLASEASHGGAVPGVGQLLTVAFPMFAVLERHLLELVMGWLGGGPLDAQIEAKVDPDRLPHLSREDIEALASAVYGPTFPASSVALMRRNYITNTGTSVAQSVAATIRVLVALWWHALLDSVAVSGAGEATRTTTPRPDDGRQLLLVRFARQYGPQVDSSGALVWNQTVWSARKFTPHALACIRHYVWPVMLSALLDRAVTHPGLNTDVFLAARAFAVASMDRSQDVSVAVFGRAPPRIAAVRVLRNTALQPAFTSTQAALTSAIQRAAAFGGGAFQRMLLRAWVASSLWVAGAAAATPTALGVFLGLSRGLSWVARAGLPRDAPVGYYAQLMTLKLVWTPLVVMWSREEEGGDPGSLVLQSAGVTAHGAGDDDSSGGCQQASSADSLVRSSTALPDSFRRLFWFQLEEYRRRAPLQSEVQVALHEILAGLPRDVAHVLGSEVFDESSALS